MTSLISREVLSSAPIHLLATQSARRTAAAWKMKPLRTAAPPRRPAEEAEIKNKYPRACLPRSNLPEVPCVETLPHNDLQTHRLVWVALRISNKEVSEDNCVSLKDKRSASLSVKGLNMEIPTYLLTRREEKKWRTSLFVVEADVSISGQWTPVSE